MYVKRFNEYFGDFSHERLDAQLEHYAQGILNIPFEDMNEEETTEFAFRIVEAEGDIDSIDIEALRESVADNGVGARSINEAAAESFAQIVRNVKAWSQDEDICKKIMAKYPKKKAKPEKTMKRLGKMVEIIDKYMDKAKNVFGKIINWIMEKLHLRKKGEVKEAFGYGASAGMSEWFFTALMLVAMNPILVAGAVGVALATGGVGALAVIAGAMFLAVKSAGGLDGFRSMMAKGGGSLAAGGANSVPTYQTSTVIQGNRTGSS
jgi:hypothetical protein